MDQVAHTGLYADPNELGLGKGTSELLGVMLARYPQTNDVGRVHPF